MSAVPSLQDIARRMYVMELTLAGEYSRLCYGFILQCQYREIQRENALPGDEVTEEVRERTRWVVQLGTRFAHSMLFRCGAILSAPYVDSRLVGTHVDVRGDEFLRVSRGAIVTLESRPRLPDSDTDSDGSMNSQRPVSMETVMMARGRVNTPIADRTRSRVFFGVGPEWIDQDGPGGEPFWVGLMEDEDSVYDGLVGIIWGEGWEMDEEAYLYDEDTNDRVLVYDVVILGSTRVFDCDGWDVLYHHLARWASTGRNGVLYDNDTV